MSNSFLFPKYQDIVCKKWRTRSRRRRTTRRRRGRRRRGMLTKSHLLC